MSISGATLKPNRPVSMFEVSPGCWVTVKWDSGLEKRYFEHLKLQAKVFPRELLRVVVKPDGVLLGDTSKAPKWYPDFLVEWSPGVYTYEEVKGIETAVWRKVRMILIDRWESKKLMTPVYVVKWDRKLGWRRELLWKT